MLSLFYDDTRCDLCNSKLLCLCDACMCTCIEHMYIAYHTCIYTYRVLANTHTLSLQRIAAVHLITSELQTEIALCYISLTLSLSLCVWFCRINSSKCTHLRHVSSRTNLFHNSAIRSAIRKHMKYIHIAERYATNVSTVSVSGYQLGES